MWRNMLSVVLVSAAACGGSDTLGQATLPPTNVAPPPEVAVRRAPPPPPPPRPPATSDPDVPSGADAARDAELAAKVSPFIDAFTNQGADLTPEGKRLLFVSNRDELPQIYVADPKKPEAPATRLVETPERVDSLTIAPDGKSVLFRTDKGADEQWTIWKIGIDGKGLVELTPGETLERDNPLVAVSAPQTVFYSARKKTEATSAIYTIPLAGGTPKKIFGSDGLGFLVDVSLDGKTLLYGRLPAPNESHLDVVDVASGKAREIYPGPDGKVAIGDAFLAADGKRLILATDTGGENRVLLALDLKTGKELARYTDTASPIAAIDGCAMTRRRTRLACSVNIGNRNEIRILDQQTLKPTTAVKMPLGSGEPSAISDDGAELLVSWSTPDLPNDIYAVSMKSGEVRRARKEERPSIAGLPPLEVTNAEATAHDGLKIPIHAYVPPDTKKVPVIVSFHGGPESVSRIRWNAMTRFFTSLGYAWVEPNVRGSSGYGRAFASADDGVKRRDALQDIQAAGQWVAEQPWADKTRLVILGGSYGGYSVLVGLSRYPELWRAGVDLFGVVNWISFMKTTSGVIRSLFLTEIGDPEKDQALLEELSPLGSVQKIVAPLFVYAGANDPRVPRSEDDQIVKALRERGVPIEYMVAPNEGHSVDRRENRIALAARAARFLEKVLAK